MQRYVVSLLALLIFPVFRISQAFARDFATNTVIIESRSSAFNKALALSMIFFDHSHRFDCLPMKPADCDFP
jgi:hypothetical protein